MIEVNKMVEVTDRMVMESREDFLRDINCVDKCILKLLMLLNFINIDKVATRFSCGGHMDDIYSEFYIQFVASSSGEQLLMRLHQLLTLKLDVNNLTAKDEDKYVIHALHYTRRYMPSYLDKPSFMVSIISYSPRDYLGDVHCFNSDAHKQKFIELFTEVVSDFNFKYAITSVSNGNPILTNFGMRAFINDDGRLDINCCDLISP